MTAVLSIDRLNVLTPLAKGPSSRLEVTLLPKQKEEVPPKIQLSDFLAQNTTAGDTIEKKVPLPATSTAPPAVPAAGKKVEEESSLPAKTQKPTPMQAVPSSPRLTREQAQHQAQAISNPSASEPGSSEALAAPQQPSAHELIAALEGRLANGFQLSSQQPRKRHLDSRTKDYTAMAYLDAWCKKIERVGKMNYPEQAKRQGLSGTLSLVVDLNPDGTLANIMVRRSSGYKILDKAAVRIVQLAAPFAKVPENVLQNHDILSITRRWQFHSNTDFRAH